MTPEGETRQASRPSTPPLVSIVTPTLDRKDLLVGTIESVRRQTYTNIEHIVVDGGSTDSTLDFLRSEGDEIKWISEPDSGVYDAVNKGMRLASGDVLAYLNTDDRYFPYTVEVAVRALGAGAATGFVFGDLLTLTLDGQGLLKFYPPFNRAYLRRGGLVAQPTVFWTRRAWESTGGFDVSFALAADMEYWMRLATSFSGSRVEEVLALEMEHEGRLTSGAAAGVTAAQEMSGLRSAYDPQHESRFRRRGFDLWDRIWMAYWYRVSLARFLWAFLRRRDDLPGQRWGGFRSEEGNFTIDVRGCAFSFVPGLGRRQKAFIAWRT